MIRFLLPSLNSSPVTYCITHVFCHIVHLDGPVTHQALSYLATFYFLLRIPRTLPQIFMWLIPLYDQASLEC